MSAATIRPMLAKAADELPAGDGWLFEMKWDGHRCTATVERNGDGAQVTMQSRSSKTDYVQQFPAIAAALADLPDCVIDGELVTPDEHGHTHGLNAKKGPARLIVFDVLRVWDTETKAWPLDERRKALAEFLVPSFPPGVIEMSPAFENGEALLEYAAENGLEGIVAKRRASRYLENSRAGDWLKVKVRPEQELVVVGWTPGKNGRTGRIGGLILAYYDGDDLVYAGRVGGGEQFDDELEAALMAAEASPLAVVPKAVPRERTWVEPSMVVQVAYQRWTDERVLWHPILKRVRHDKDPRDVTKEGLE